LLIVLRIHVALFRFSVRRQYRWDTCAFPIPSRRTSW
jgi:hypothetical protein